MATSRGTGGSGRKAVRGVLVGSLSVDTPGASSSSSSSPSSTAGKKHRRHSETTTGTGPTKEVDGSLRRVSRWFRDIKQKMDPIKVKDRIRYSRSSLVAQMTSTEDEEVEVFQGSSKTATLGPWKPGKKCLEKRFNSMECLPATAASGPKVIRKMNSLQFEAGEDPMGLEAEVDLEEEEEEATHLKRRPGARGEEEPTASSTEDRLARMTEEIELKLEEKERLLREILEQTITCQSPSDKDSSMTKVKASLLESSYLTNELTHLINEAIRPEHLHASLNTMPEPRQEDQSEQKAYTYVTMTSQLANVITRLYQQLITLLVAVDENAERMKVLGDEMGAMVTEFSATVRRCSEGNALQPSLSDSACFLTLIDDLKDAN